MENKRSFAIGGEALLLAAALLSTSCDRAESHAPTQNEEVVGIVRRYAIAEDRGALIRYEDKDAVCYIYAGYRGNSLSCIRRAK